MSPLVRVCSGCQRRRGATSFRIIHKGRRSERCRACEAEGKGLHVRGELTRLARQEARIRSELQRITKQKVALREQLVRS